MAVNKQNNRAVSPVIGVILLVGVITAIVSLSAISLFDSNIGVNEEPDVNIDIIDKEQAIIIDIVNNYNVDEFILRTPNGKEKFDSRTESIRLSKSLPGDYTLISVTGSDTKNIVERLTIDGSYTTVTGKVSTNPDIDGAVVQATVNGQFVNKSETDQNGLYSVKTSDINNTTISVKVDGFTSPELTYPLYAGSQRETSGDTSIDFTFNNLSEKTVDGETIYTSYTVSEQNVGNVISTIEQLQAINSSLDYEIANNIDAKKTEDWNSGSGFIPIENYTGNINGNSYTISNVYIKTKNNNNNGLFKETTGARIKNIVLNNFDLKHEISSTGGNRYGLLVGETDENTVIHNVDIKNSNLSSPDNDIIGGIVGRNNGLVEMSSVVNTSIEGNENVGGIIGSNGGSIAEGEIINTYARAEVTGKNNVGGLIGNDFSSKSISIQKSYSSSIIYPTGSVSENNYGAIAGKVIDSIDGSNIYWDYKKSDMQFSAQLNSAGSGSYDSGKRLSTSDMTGKSPKEKMSGLNFDVLWEIEPGYPIQQY